MPFCNDLIGHAKLVHDMLHELDFLGGIELDEWLLLYPFSELVDSHIDVLKATQSSFEGSNHIKSPT